MRRPRKMEPAAAGVIDFYVRTHDRNGLILRTSVALSAIRSILPRCLLEDRELLDLIERAVVKHRAMTIFDVTIPPLAGAAEPFPSYSMPTSAPTKASA